MKPESWHESRVAELLARFPGAAPYKQWRYEQGRRLGISETGIFMRVKRGLYPNLCLHRANKRVVFVLP